MSTYRNTTSGSTNTNTRLIQFTASGTAAVTAGSAVVTGTSTFFNSTNRLKKGDFVTINGETKRVVSVASNTSFTVDSAFAATASGQTLTYVPFEAVGAGASIAFVKASPANTANIVLGQSQNLAKDGADVTATSNMWLLTPGEITPPIAFNDLRDWYIQSSVASQAVNIIIN